MFNNYLILKNPRSGMTKVAPLGFSWTVLLFGFFVPLIRKDWLWTFIMFVLDVVTIGIASIFFAFAYNRTYINHLLKRGFLIYQIEGSLTQKNLKLFTETQDKVFNNAFQQNDYLSEEINDNCHKVA